MFLVSTAFFFADVVSDVMSTLDNMACVQNDHPAGQKGGSSLPAAVAETCSLLTPAEWWAVIDLSFLHVSLPFCLFASLFFCPHVWRRHKKKELPSGAFVGMLYGMNTFVMRVLLAPVYFKWQILRFSIFKKDYERLENAKEQWRRGELEKYNHKMATTDLTEASLEANYHLLVNFLLAFPHILGTFKKRQTGLGHLDFLWSLVADRHLLTKTVAVATSFATLIYNSGKFQSRMKRGALDFDSNKTARCCLMLMVAVETLSRLYLVSLFAYRIDKDGSVNLDMTACLIFFYAHFATAFLLNLFLNRAHMSECVISNGYLIEAAINAFSSFFTYSDYSIYRTHVMANKDRHYPSFVRQSIFYVVYLAEFLALVLAAYTGGVKAAEEVRGHCSNFSFLYARYFLSLVLLENLNTLATNQQPSSKSNSRQSFIELRKILKFPPCLLSNHFLTQSWAFSVIFVSKK